jgi:hypothetical protein
MPRQCLRVLKTGGRADSIRCGVTLRVSTRHSVCCVIGMAEIIAELDIQVIADGRSYFPNVVAEQDATGRWEAWIEFVPADESEALLTDTETYQATRDDVVDWATTLTETFLQGAFSRAGGTSRSAVTMANLPEAVTASASVDPFLLYEQGPIALRAALRPLTRTELLTIINVYGLNPAQLSLSRLSNLQLVTFIVTATEIQFSRGRPAAR